MKKIILLALLLVVSYTYAQNKNKKDKAIYLDKKPGYYQNVVLKTVSEEDNTFVIPKENNSKSFVVDLSEYKFPVDTSKYVKQWHNSPINQGLTGTCWCFAGTSFIESEIYRINKLKIKLSEMYTVYWEYFERAKLFAEKHGDMYFNEGSEVNAVTKIMRLYGAVPATSYSGLLPGKTVYNHEVMVTKLKNYLESVKKSNNWDAATILKSVKTILNNYMGEPPTTVSYEGKIYTPKEFVNEVMKINPLNYFPFMSTKSLVYNQKGIFDEPDNWWHSDDYYNLSLDNYMKLILNSIQKGYTVAICGDVSEPGYSAQYQVAVVPTFDCPSEYINEDARQLRVNNSSTTDDHCLHLVGYYKNTDGKYWFLIKDSGSGGFDGKTRGYRFYHEDYIKLKMLNILVYKDAAREFLDKIIK